MSEQFYIGMIFQDICPPQAAKWCDDNNAHIEKIDGVRTIVQNFVKTKQYFVKQSNEKLNKICDEKILNNFVWNNEQFYMTVQNQINFTNMYLSREFLTYPQTIKTKNGYTSIANAEEVESFYLAGVSFVKQCLEECWKAKQQAEIKILEEN